MARTDLLYDVRGGDLTLVPIYPKNSDIVDLWYDNGYLKGIPESMLKDGGSIYARIPFNNSSNEILVEAPEDSVVVRPRSSIVEVVPGGGSFIPGGGVQVSVTYNAYTNGYDGKLLMRHLPFISLDVFKVTFEKVVSRLTISDGKCYDMKIGVAKNQNSNLLTLCDKGNNYRYPNTGVGVRKYVNSHLSSSILAKEIIDQFSQDSVTVVSATFDSDTGSLDIETKEV